MVNQFKRGCKYCSKQIRMVKDQSGKWMAYEVNEDVHHNCQQPYYEQPPNNKTRDKSMAPVSKPVPPPKDPARLAWEKRNKEIQDMQLDKKPKKSEVEKAIIDFVKQDDPQQILITELSKQTHLLNEINDNLIKLVFDNKKEVDEND